MAKARIIRGGWFWLGVERRMGDVVEASDAQIASWAADRLVTPIVAEAAVIEPPETTSIPRARAKKG